MNLPGMMQEISVGLSKSEQYKKPHSRTQTNERKIIHFMFVDNNFLKCHASFFLEGVSHKVPGEERLFNH